MEMLNLFYSSGILSLVVMTLCVVASLTEGKSAEAGQPIRIGFWLASTTTWVSVTAVFVALVISKISGAVSPFWSGIIPLIAGLLSCVKFASNQMWFVTVPGNTLYAATPNFFGRMAENGIIVYKIFSSGFKWKFPWEVFEGYYAIEIEKGIIQTDKIEAEFSDAIGIVSTTLTFVPDRPIIQNYLAVDKNPDERNKFIAKMFNDAYKMAIAVYASDKKAKGKTIIDALAEIAQIPSLISSIVVTEGTEQLTVGEIISRKEKLYGVKVNSFIVNDIGMSDEVKKTYEQTAVTRMTIERANLYLKQMGYSDAAISGNVPPEDRIKPDVLAQVYDWVKETSGEIKREINEVRIKGLGDLSPEAAAALGAGIIAALNRRQSGQRHGNQQRPGNPGRQKS